MKNHTFIYFLLSLSLIFACQYLSAQDYVLTASGDSLTGETKPLLYGTEKKVQLDGTDGEKISFSIFQVRSFSYDGDIYHPIKGDNGYVFMKLLQSGYLSLYAYQPENQTRFDGLFLKKLDGAGMVVPNLGFKKYMSKFLEDCPQIADRVKEGELGKKNLSELINAYNACIDKRTFGHEQLIADRRQQTSKISEWDALEESIHKKDFGEKTNALEMIAEIRKKIQRQEKIPNFLLEALRNSLAGTGLTTDLEVAIEGTKP